MIVKNLNQNFFISDTIFKTILSNCTIDVGSPCTFSAWKCEKLDEPLLVLLETLISKPY